MGDDPLIIRLYPGVGPACFGSSVDAAGLHAGAGKIEGFGPESEGLRSQVRYFDLEGTVENPGTITADIVELVGRHVVNGRPLQAPGGPPGCYRLVVGAHGTLLRARRVDRED